MKILVWIGIPYNQWYEWEKAPMKPQNPFLNFILEKGDFHFSLITRDNGTAEIKMKIGSFICFDI